MLFKQRPSIVVTILILLLTAALTSCNKSSDASTRVPSQQAVTAVSNTIPATPTSLPQPTATIVSVQTQPPATLTIEVDQLLSSYVDNGTFSGAVLIARDGMVLMSSGYGLADREANLPNTPQTRFRIGSITKQFTAAATLLLQQQGKLTIQDNICEYLSNCPPAWETITIHHLLTHTSGIPDFTRFPEYPSWRATPSPPTQTLNRFNGRPLDFPSGQNWDYSNSGYIVLGLVIEQAAGQSYEGFLQDYIFTPLNMTATGLEHNSNELAIGYMKDTRADFIDMSTPYSAGGLFSTVEDLYLWDQALFHGTLLTQDSLNSMLTAYATIPRSEGLAYGYGWIIGQYDGHRMFEHRGAIEGFASVNTYFPDDDLFIIFLSNLQSTPLNSLYPSLVSQIISSQ